MIDKVWKMGTSARMQKENAILRVSHKVAPGKEKEKVSHPAR